MKISYNDRYVQVMPLTPKIEHDTSIATDENKFQATDENKFQATYTKLAGKRPRGRPATRQETIDKQLENQ